MKRAHPSDSDFAEPSRPRSPPGIPTRNEELFSTEDGRRKWLVDERESLRQSIINYADYEEYLCGMVEDQGKTVSSIPTGIHFALVRSLRQLAKLNILIEECEKDKSVLMGDITFWREEYKDVMAEDMLGAAKTIWKPERSSRPPSIIMALWSTVHIPLPPEWRDEFE